MLAVRLAACCHAVSHVCVRKLQQQHFYLFIQQSHVLLLLLLLLTPHGIIRISHVLTFTHVVRKLTAATVHTTAANVVVVAAVVVVLLLMLAVRACFMFLLQITSKQPKCCKVKKQMRVRVCATCCMCHLQLVT